MHIFLQKCFPEYRLWKKDSKFKNSTGSLWNSRRMEVFSFFFFLILFYDKKHKNNHRWGPSEGANTFIIVTYTLSHDRDDLVMPRLSRHFPRPPRDFPWNEKFIVVFMQKPAELKHNNFHSVLASENSAIYLWDLYKGSSDLSKVSNDPLIIQSSKVTSE